MTVTVIMTIPLIIIPLTCLFFFLTYNTDGDNLGRAKSRAREICMSLQGVSVSTGHRTRRMAATLACHKFESDFTLHSSLFSIFTKHSS